MFTDSTTKVENEPQNGSNEDITNPYECEQTLNDSAGTLNLSAAFFIYFFLSKFLNHVEVDVEVESESEDQRSSSSSRRRRQPHQTELQGINNIFSHMHILHTLTIQRLKAYNPSP
ncbi:hypothetical protein Tco_0018875 [Tanacetum coccineum]